jgi:hypothetical protein
MSYKTRLIKLAIKWTPKKMVMWVANKILKDIAELKDFEFDIDTREAYVQTQLFGETDTIDVWLEGFAIIHEEGSYKFIMEQVTSNRPWLANAMAHVTGRAWPIPVIPQLAPHMPLFVELFQAEKNTEQA